VCDMAGTHPKAVGADRFSQFGRSTGDKLDQIRALVLLTLSSLIRNAITQASGTEWHL